MNGTPLREWLRHARAINDAHLDIMAARYDLDGALEAGQTGLAWWAQEQLLRRSLELVLLQAGIAGDGQDETEQTFDVLRRLAALDEPLADQVWELWLRPFPPASDLLPQIDQTLDFVRDRLRMPWVVDRRSTVATWAENTSVLRAVARTVGIAQSDTWYLSSSNASAGDWYDDVMRALDAEQRQ